MSYGLKDISNLIIKENRLCRTILRSHVHIAVVLQPFKLEYLKMVREWVNVGIVQRALE